jgi:formylglycine-generating enzyme required for sulfatase activity
MQVSSAVMLAMEMKGEDRFQNVEDFRLALQQMAGGQKKKEEQKTVLNPKKENVINENSKTVHSSTPAGKNNKVIIFSLIGVAALVLILLVVFNPFGSGNNKPELEIEMVDVMGGSFLMGCTVEQGNNCFGNEFPVHQVTLSAYKIGKYEVTQAQWREVMGNNPSSFRDCDKCPVEQVNWNDVQDFISKLNEKTGKTYRLPTEAEWEFAARGANGSRRYIYSGSNNLDDVAWYEVTGNSKTHEVGMKIPNELGIYDMSGNVWEWCSDWSGVYNAAEETNPSGATTGKNRVLRGGSWDFKAEYCRVSHSNSDLPIRRNDRIGFRLVLVP